MTDIKKRKIENHFFRESNRYFATFVSIMDVLIIEDEQLLAIELADKLLDLDEKINIVAQLASVDETVKWLSHNSCDLIFMDIHLSDGSSFAIFDKIEVKTPVIFTTAYDQYAIRAFQVQGIGYLLKPIDGNELQQALEKYRGLEQNFSLEVNALLDYLTNPLAPTKKTLTRIVLNLGKIQVPINIEDIAYFMADGRYLFAVTKAGKKYFYENTLYKLEEVIDNNLFFRLNRRYIINFNSVVSFTPYSKSRVKVELNPQPEEEIIVGSEKIKEFKQWLED